MAETYLKRAYRQRLAKNAKKNETNDNNFPFWDYRSRRGSLSTSASCTSSSGSSFDACSLASLSSIRSADTASINSSLSSSDSDSVMVTSDPYRLQLQFVVDAHEVLPLLDLYQPLIDWVDQDLQLLKVGEKTDVGVCSQSISQSRRVSHMPGVAIMIFLGENGPQGHDRIQTAKRRFEKPPWKFHHSEQVGHGKINLYPYNSPDYFYTSEELPLWAVRLVHCGKEFIRIVLFASEEFWDDMLQFYKLIIGFDPDVSREDFCLFTIHSRENYEVQFALKKLKGETKPRVLDSVKLQFRVPEVGSLVPLFPNVCKPISDRLWETQDHDGNVILIDVTGRPRPTSSTPSDYKSSASNDSCISRHSSQSSALSANSVQSLTSVTSSVTSSITSMSSEDSDRTNTLTDKRTAVSPPEVPPRVPVKSDSIVPPSLPEKPNQCLEAIKGFYV